MNKLCGWELLERADKIAADAHAGATYGPTRPYIEHPREVEALARGLGYSAEVRACCLLHDTIEDTWVTEDFLTSEGMPISVVRGVVAVTWEGNGDIEAKLKQAKSTPVGHVTKFCDSGRNFATTVNDPFALGIEKAQINAVRYALNVGELALDLPTPDEVFIYCRSVDCPTS